MDWLEQHLRTYVLPSLRVIRRSLPAKSQKPLYVEKCDCPQVPSALTPMVGELRPAKGYPDNYTGLLVTGLKSFGMFEYLSGDTIQALRNGFLPLDSHTYSACQRLTVSASGNRRATPTNDEIAAFVRDQHTIIKNSLRRLQKTLSPGCRIVFLGRDVWLWYVVAQALGYTNVVFDPRVSRTVARDQKAFRSILTGSSMRLNDGDILFDTGFAGSIYKAATDAVPEKRLRCYMLSTPREGWALFPNHRGARARALTIEYWPKYQQSGTVKEGCVVQRYAQHDEFVHAAIMTIQFYSMESPRWVPGPPVLASRKVPNNRTKGLFEMAVWPW